MIGATFNAVIPTPIIAEFEAIVPREKALEVKNKNITIEQNGSYTVKADADTIMTKVEALQDEICRVQSRGFHCPCCGENWI